MDGTTTPNPYAAPRAAVQDVHGEQAPQPVRLWSARGRIGRLRYFVWPLLMSFALVMPLAALGGFVSAVTRSEAPMLLGGVAYLVAFVFYALMTVQRCHDMNWTGWAALLALIPLVGLIFLIVRGTPGSNRYGPPPPPNPPALKWGAALVIGLFLLGIVAAIALPAYSAYMQRAKATAPAAR